MPTAKQKFGQKGEDAAERYLKQKNYFILYRHYTTRWGEIDLIAQDKGELVFVEVKTRQTDNFGLPEEAVTEEKFSHLVKAAYCYLEENDYLEEKYRFDLISIFYSLEKNSFTIRHLKNIFLLEDCEIDF